MEVNPQLHAPAALPLGVRDSDNLWIGGCVRPTRWRRQHIPSLPQQKKRKQNFHGGHLLESGYLENEEEEEDGRVALRQILRK